MITICMNMISIHCKIMDRTVRITRDIVNELRLIGYGLLESKNKYEIKINNYMLYIIIINPQK